MLAKELIVAFTNIVGKENILIQKEDLIEYGHDETETIQHTPEIVLKPGNTNQISSIMALCNQHQIIVTPRGAGTGLSGGAIPHLGGIVLSLEKLNKIIRID